MYDFFIENFDTSHSELNKSVAMTNTLIVDILEKREANEFLIRQGKRATFTLIYCVQKGYVEQI